MLYADAFVGVDAPCGRGGACQLAKAGCRLSFGTPLLGGTPLEPFHTPTAIYELLLAGVEGVALRANLYVEL
jgi:hypothetical protein